MCHLEPPSDLAKIKQEWRKDIQSTNALFVASGFCFLLLLWWLVDLFVWTKIGALKSTKYFGLVLAKTMKKKTITNHQY